MANVEVTRNKTGQDGEKRELRETPNINKEEYKSEMQQKKVVARTMHNTDLQLHFQTKKGIRKEVNCWKVNTK